MKVAIIPYDIVWSDKRENLLAIGEILSNVSSDTDIVVLPEMFTTGFITDPVSVMQLAEPNTGETISTLHKWTKQYNFAICGSFIAVTANECYNRAFFIEPSGDETFYDKKHLFSVGGETKVYKNGSMPAPLIRYRGWNINLLICYDLRFPLWCRNINNCYDLMIVVANWPNARVHAWSSLLIARAIENQTYVIGANRSGCDDFGNYPIENSFVVDYKGNIISQVLEQSPIIIYAKLDNSKLNTFRDKFPVWKDADRFCIL